jgi:glycosyltransferase involved in cell wall biosynthesis
LFERSYDLETVIEAARRLQTTGRTAAQFVFCGDGSKMAGLKRQAGGLKNIHFLGWVDAPTLQATLSISTIGLCAYADDALQSWPNKPFEYMANNLAVVSSLSGDLAQLLDRHQCGLTYTAGDAGSLANCLHVLLANSKQLSAMRSNAYAAWWQNYRSSKIYDQFVAQLEALPQVATKAA